MHYFAHIKFKFIFKMSIFQPKEWWSAKVGNNEEFDYNSVCVSNIDNDEQDCEPKIIVGSFEGFLRIYKPNRKGNHEYHVDDLVIEKNMELPILQVSCGYFSSKHGDKLCLGVLSTRQLSIHKIVS